MKFSEIHLQKLKKTAQAVRKDILDMVYQAQSGHPGGSLGCVEYFIALYFHVMQYKKTFAMHGKEEDIFFLSNGHISPVWYSVLARAGFFSKDELSTFRKINTRLQGHPSIQKNLSGIRIASGSLGQGLSVAIGAALAKKNNQDPRHVYVLMGDGELQEGQVWEAAMFAAHHRVDNIIATVDYNGQQIDGRVADILSLENIKEKWQSFGWHVLESQGNDLANIIACLEQAKILTGNQKPIINLMTTTMGKGVSFMENRHQWHGIAPNTIEYQQAITEIEEKYLS